MSILKIVQNVNKFQSGTEKCRCENKGTHLYLCTLSYGPHTRVVCDECLPGYADSFCECGNGGNPGGDIASVLNLEGKETDMETAIDKVLNRNATSKGNCRGCHRDKTYLFQFDHCDSERCYYCTNKCHQCQGHLCKDHGQSYEEKPFLPQLVKVYKCTRSKCPDCDVLIFEGQRTIQCEICNKCCSHTSDKVVDVCTICKLTYCSRCVSSKFPEVCSRCQDYNLKTCPGCHERFPFLLKCEGCQALYCDEWCHHN